MFSKLFAESGLSLDRLRALVEVGAAGSIVRAAESDPVRQSQFSRQIKELEDFFQAGLIERHGKGVRLTAAGKELARISRFFLLGLSNFQRGCLAEGQTYRIGASATFVECFLMPLLAGREQVASGIRFAVEVALADEMERRLHDLTLDFVVISRTVLSRPLQMEDLGSWGLKFWVPKTLCATEKQAGRAFAERRLPLVWPAGEVPLSEFALLEEYELALACSNFLEARVALEEQSLAAFLPDFFPIEKGRGQFLSVKLPALASCRFRYGLGWNPRLLRLNPHAGRRRDALRKSLAQALTAARARAGQRSARGPSEGFAGDCRGSLCVAIKRAKDLTRTAKARNIKVRMKWKELKAEAVAEVEATLAELPAPLRERAQALPVTFERYPSRALEADGIEPDTMGLFVGPDFSAELNTPSPLPPQIILFFENIWEEAEGDPARFREEVRRTFLHELGHYLGLDEDGLFERGLD